MACLFTARSFSYEMAELASETKGVRGEYQVQFPGPEGQCELVFACRTCKVHCKISLMRSLKLIRNEAEKAKEDETTVDKNLVN